VRGYRSTPPRMSFGVAPNRALNARLKYEISEKPAVVATSLIFVRSLFGSRSLARQKGSD